MALTGGLGRLLLLLAAMKEAKFITSRGRLLTLLRGEVPDCVPVAPDFSNMIPARRTGKPFWDLYLYKDPPTEEVKLDTLGLAPEPETYQAIEGVKEVDTGPGGLARVMDLMGDQGLVGIEVISSRALTSTEAIYEYYDHPELHEKWAHERVKLMAEETNLSIIDPLEIPPMGDCNLAELKKLYGDRIILKGNLHTTEVMLNKGKNVVIEASKKAIDDGARGGGFILSTGDQCGRDTPDENLFTMVDTARTYGRY